MGHRRKNTFNFRVKRQDRKTAILFDGLRRMLKGIGANIELDRTAPYYHLKGFVYQDSGVAQR